MKKEIVDKMKRTMAENRTGFDIARFRNETANREKRYSRKVYMRENPEYFKQLYEKLHPLPEFREEISSRCHDMWCVVLTDLIVKARDFRFSSGGWPTRILDGRSGDIKFLCHLADLEHDEIKRLLRREGNGKGNSTGFDRRSGHRTTKRRGPKALRADLQVF